MSIRTEAEAKYPRIVGERIDYKAWARRIVYREERGDKEITAVQLRFAREALDLIEPAKQ